MASPSSNGAPHNGTASGLDGPGLLYNEARQASGERASRLREWADVLWNGKWIILGVFAVVLAAGAYYTYSIAPTYQTSSLLLIDQGEGQMVPSFASNSRSPYGSGGRTIANELLILRQSRAVARKVADSLKALGTNPWTGQPIRLLYGSGGNELSTEQVARRVQGRISAGSAGQDVDALRIYATSTRPAEAALVANVYAEAYIARSKERSRSSLAASRQFLEEQVATFQERVQEAEQAVEEYVREEQAVALDQKTSQTVTKIAELEARRAELKIDLEMKRATREQTADELERIEPQLANRIALNLDDRLQRLQEEQARLETTIDQIERANPELRPSDSSDLARQLRQKKERLRTLEGRVDSLAQRYVDKAVETSGGGEGSQGVSYVAQQKRRLATLRVDINGLEAQLDVVDQRLAERRQDLREIPTQSMRMAQLQRERRSAERIYSYVREQLQQVRMKEEAERGYAEVVSQAGVPSTPIAPNNQQNLFLAGLLGLLLGGGLVVLREQLDTRLHGPADIESHGHRVVGVVPSMDKMIADEFDGSDTIEHGGQAVSTSLAVLVSPMSAPAEAYRRIRTNLQFARPDDSLRALTVTSAEKGEGKTTTAANLALALASAGRRTLLVDADLRHPRLHERFHMAAQPGLTDLLFKDDAPDLEAFATGIDDFSVLPAGEVPPNPSEVMASDRLAELVQHLSTQFDSVVIDTPPVLLFSDAMALSPRCDGTLLVTAADETDHRALNHAADLLDDVQAPMLGVILNRFSGEGSGYYYGGAQYGYQRLEEYYADTEPRTLADTARSWLDRVRS